MRHWSRGRLATRLSHVAGTPSAGECEVVVVEEEETSMVKVAWEPSTSLRVQKGTKSGEESSLAAEEKW
jgi:hypothetical protein